MSNNNFFDLFNDIDDKFIEEAEDIPQKNFYTGHTTVKPEMNALSGIDVLFDGESPNDPQKPVYLEGAPVKFGVWHILSIIAGAAVCVAILAAALYLSVGHTIIIQPGEIGSSESSDLTPSGGGVSPKVIVDKYGATVMLTGEPIKRTELSEYRAAPDLGILDKEISAFFERERVSEELYAAYMNAWAFRFIWSGKIGGNVAVPGLKTYTVLKVPKKGKSNGSEYVSFWETGISYESFYSALCGAFTEESAAAMMRGTEAFYEFDGQLWTASFIYTSELPIIHTEFETVVSNENEFVFNSVFFLDNNAAEYDPDRRGDYKSYTVENRFVNTADGWRAVEIAINGTSSLTGEASGGKLF